MCRGSGRIVEERAGKALPGLASPPSRPPRSIRRAARRRARPASPSPSAGPSPTEHPLPYRDRGELLPWLPPSPPPPSAARNRGGKDPPAPFALPVAAGLWLLLRPHLGRNGRSRIAHPPAARGSLDPARRLCAPQEMHVPRPR